jgi:hypothetical protein
MLLIIVGLCSMQAPIYISKQIVLTDAIRIGYGVGRVRNSKPIYDVSLDRYLAKLAYLCLIINVISMGG